MIPKVLIAAPTSDYKDYCLKEWAGYLKSLTYPNKEIFIVDNSKNPEYHKKINDMGLPCVYHRPVGMTDLREIMTSGQNVIREKFLREKFDYLFLNESDQFAAPNIIEYLMNQRRHVIGLPYFIGVMFDSRIISFKEESFGYVRTAQAIYNDEGFFWFDGKIKPVFQLGFGCILIHKAVIEKIPFRVDLRDKDKSHSDTYFHNDCDNLGIPIYADTNFMSYHWNGNWDKIAEKER